MKLKNYLSLVAALLITFSAQAHEYRVGDLHLEHPYARATAPGQPAAGGYIGITNQGKDADKLISASSPAVESVEIHTMLMEGNVMRMRALESLEIAPGETIKMQPGKGLHIMLIGLKQALKAGDKVPVTLVFEKAGKVDVELMVHAIKAGDKAHMHH
jgi:copper(I)-binding protein